DLAIARTLRWRKADGSNATPCGAHPFSRRVAGHSSGTFRFWTSRRDLNARPSPSDGDALVHLSYETMLGLKLRVPVEVVHPALVQIAGWKRALGCQQLIERRLLRWTPWLNPQRVALARVARDAGRNDVGPPRLAAARTRNDVLERQR